MAKMSPKKRRSRVLKAMAERRRITAAGCWEWTGHVNSGGYGVYGAPIGKVHRLAYELFVGTIPHGGIVHHVCFNKLCFNPKHLMVATRQDHVTIHEALKKEALVRMKASDLIRFDEDDRKVLREASERLEELSEPYLAGRLAGLSGRVPAGSVSDEQHQRDCELAGCKHPALYDNGVQGWCARCRAVAFGGDDDE